MGGWFTISLLTINHWCINRYIAKKLFKILEYTLNSKF